MRHALLVAFFGCAVADIATLQLSDCTLSSVDGSSEITSNCTFAAAAGQYTKAEVSEMIAAAVASLQSEIDTLKAQAMPPPHVVSGPVEVNGVATWADVVGSDIFVKLLSTGTGDAGYYTYPDTGAIGTMGATDNSMQKLSDADIATLRAAAFKTTDGKSVYRLKSPLADAYAWVASGGTWDDTVDSFGMFSDGLANVDGALSTTIKSYSGWRNGVASWTPPTSCACDASISPSMINGWYHHGSLAPRLDFCCEAGQSKNRYFLGHGSECYGECGGSTCTKRCFSGYQAQGGSGHDVLTQTEVFLFLRTQVQVLG